MCVGALLFFLAFAQAEVREHELQVPAPRSRDHDHRRRGEMRQYASNGYIHEQQAERRVGQPAAGVQRVELPREEQRADRHRRRFRDERAQQRREDQDREPPSRGCAAPQTRDRPQAAFREVEHGARRRQGHDDHDKHRLDVAHLAVEVADDLGPALEPRDRPRQRHHPDPEHGLDLAEEVQGLPGEADLALRAGARPPSRRMAFLHLVGPVPDPRRQESMDDGGREDAQRDEVERLRFRPVAQHFPESRTRRIAVAGQ